MATVELNDVATGEMTPAQAKREPKINQFFRAVSRACFQCFNDVHVVAYRTVGAVLFTDRLAPDHAHVREKIFGEVDQDVVAAKFDDRLVEFDVDVGIFIKVRT